MSLQNIHPDYRASNMKCKVQFKGSQHDAIIIDTKLDKIKVKIFDKSGEILGYDWYENKQIKRQW